MPDFGIKRMQRHAGIHQLDYSSGKNSKTTDEIIFDNGKCTNREQ